MEVAPERLERWLAGFGDRHGPPEVDGARLRAPDGAVAEVEVPFGPLEGDLVAHCLRPRRLGLLLVRLGGHAVGVAEGERLVLSKVGSRQVHGRSAAGGWSQQRFARRRANQTDAVVGAAVETAVRVLLPHAGEVEVLFTGGDRGLVDDVLADPRLRALAALRRGPALEVGDPTKAVLLETPSQFRAVDVHILEPGDRSP